MGWWAFCAIAWLSALLFVPSNRWRKSFVIGIIGMLIILAIDNSLAILGAFRFHYEGLKIFQLPLPYVISYFPGAVLFVHLRPTKRLNRLLYIFASAIIFASIEYTVIRLGLFQHLNWTLTRAFILNIGGFTTLLWFAEWLDVGGREGIL